MTHDQSSHDRALEEACRPDIAFLASTVIKTLNGKSDDTRCAVRTSMLQWLLTECQRSVGYDSGVTLAGLRNGRLLPDQIVDTYIPEAARALGAMWASDEISFAQVTIATARLQELLTHISVPWCPEASNLEDSVTILMVLQADDTHRLGSHVAITQLRRLGATVRVLFGTDADTLAEMVTEESYDLLMFSCSNKDTLATISEIIKSVRSLVEEAPPMALGGLVLDLADRVKETTGADLVTSDVRVAFKLCDRKRQKLRTLAK